MTDFPDTDFSSPDWELRLRDWIRHGGADNVVTLRNGYYCTQCEERIPEDSIVGPLRIFIQEPCTPEGYERDFCTWTCAADWFQIQAGR